MEAKIKLSEVLELLENSGEYVVNYSYYWPQGDHHHWTKRRYIPADENERFNRQHELFINWKTHECKLTMVDFDLNAGALFHLDEGNRYKARHYITFWNTEGITSDKIPCSEAP